MAKSDDNLTQVNSDVVVLKNCYGHNQADALSFVELLCKTSISNAKHLNRSKEQFSWQVSGPVSPRPRCT